MGWTDADDRRFFGELHDAGIDRDGLQVGGMQGITAKVKAIAFLGRTGSTERIIDELTEIRTILGEISEENLTDAQRAVKPRLEAKIEAFKNGISLGKPVEEPDEKKAAFLAGATDPFWAGPQQRTILGRLYDAQFDAEGKELPGLAGLVKLFADVKEQEAFDDLYTRFRDEIEKIPTTKRTAQQRQVSYYTYELRQKREQEEAKNAPDGYTKNGWIKPGEKEFWETMRAAGKNADGQELPVFNEKAESLAEISKAKLWLVIPRLEEMRQELGAVAEGSRTEKQREALGLLDAKLAELTQLHQELKAQREQDNLEAAKKADGPMLVGEKYTAAEIYRTVIEEGREKKHLWQDAATVKANLLNSLAEPARGLVGRLGEEKRNAFEETCSEIRSGEKIKDINAEGRGEAFREWDGVNAGERRIPVKRTAAEADIPWIDQKLKDTAEVYRSLSHDVISGELKEYFNGYIFALDDTHGNYLEALEQSAYLDRLLEVKSSHGLREDVDPEQSLKGLKGLLPEQTVAPEELRPADISADYMRILNAFENELKMEYKKQKLERSGYADEMEVEGYKQNLREEHEKTISAFERLCAIEDNGQYNAYLQKPLSWITGKNDDPLNPGLAVVIGCMRGENKALDMGWDIRETGIMGMFGAINAAYERKMQQMADAPDAELILDIAQLKMDLWEKNVNNDPKAKHDAAEGLKRFIDKYENDPTFKDVIKDHGKKMEASLKYTETAYRKSLPDEEYRREDKAEFDRTLEAYKAIVDVSNKSKAFDSRIPALEMGGHTDSTQYTDMTKAVHALFAIGKGASANQMKECLKRASETADAYAQKLKTFEGMVGKGKKRLQLAKDVKKFADEQLRKIGPKLEGLDPYASVGERAYEMAKDAPDIAANRRNVGIITNEKKENGNYSIRKSFFELIEEDDPDVRLGKVRAIEQEENEKKNLEDSKNRARNPQQSHRMNINEMAGGEGHAPQRNHAVHRAAPQHGNQAGHGNNNPGMGRNHS